MNETHASGEPLSADTIELIRRIEECQGTDCRLCGRPLCADQVLASIALGSGKAPRCLECLAAALEQTVPALVESLRGYFHARECFRAAWEWAHRMPSGMNGGERCCALAASRNPERQSDSSA